MADKVTLKIHGTEFEVPEAEAITYHRLQNRIRYLETIVKLERFDKTRAVLVPSKEDSLDRLFETGREFAAEQQSVEDTVITNTITSTDRHCVAFSMQRSNEYLENEVAMTQSARQYKSATDLICRTDIAGLDCRNMRENGDVCGTLQAKGSGGQSLNTTHPVRVGMIVRRLTPLECERLQGFPDGWTNILGASDSGRYKALGNSVAIPCVEFVMRGIAFVLKNSDGR